MKFSAIFLTLLTAAIPATAQIELISDSYFPAELEFEELQNIASESSFSDSKQLSGIDDGRVIMDEGFEDYSQRTYTIGSAGLLSIEIVTLIDYRAAYSLLSLFRTSDILEGPPGDAYASIPDGILFCHGKRWVRIRSGNASDALLGRIAASVSNRIGKPKLKFPSLIDHLPESGLEIGSLKYYPGSKAFESFRAVSSNSIIQNNYDMEIARARYSLGNQSGILSLLKFPTPQLAEEYFSELPAVPVSDNENRVYLRRSGPLLCVLEGTFSSDSARNILGAVQYSYSVQWIFDKKAHPSTVWGIPAAILKTTVWSFFLVVMVCASSILAGAGIAAFRLLLRRFLPHNPLDDPKRTEIIQLRLP